MKLYECTFLDEYSEETMRMCDIPTNDEKKIVYIINSYGRTPFTAFKVADIIELKEQDGFKNLPRNSNTIKYYHA